MAKAMAESAMGAVPLAAAMLFLITLSVVAFCAEGGQQIQKVDMKIEVKDEGGKIIQDRHGFAKLKWSLQNSN